MIFKLIVSFNPILIMSRGINFTFVSRVKVYKFYKFCLVLGIV